MDGLGRKLGSKYKVQKIVRPRGIGPGARQYFHRLFKDRFETEKGQAWVKRNAKKLATRTGRLFLQSALAGVGVVFVVQNVRELGANAQTFNDELQKFVAEARRGRHANKSLDLTNAAKKVFNIENSDVISNFDLALKRAGDRIHQELRDDRSEGYTRPAKSLVSPKHIRPAYVLGSDGDLLINRIEGLVGSQ